MQLSTKLSIASSVVTLIIISALSLSSYLLFKDVLEVKTKSYVEDNAKLISHDISTWLMGKSVQLDILKSQIESNFSDDNFQKALELEVFKGEFLLMFGTLAHEETLRSNDPFRNSPDIDFRQRAWYQQGANLGITSFTPPYRDAVSNDLLLSIVSPIFQQGELKGVIGADLTLETISTQVNSVNFNDTGFVFISDEEGNIITHPNSKFNGESTADIYNITPAVSEQIITIDYNNKSHLIYFYPLLNAKGMSWHLGVLLDKNKVYEALFSLSARSITFVIISIILCALILQFLAKKLLKPLQNLEQAIINIASGQGDLRQRLDITTHDECGSTASHFNEFISYLQQLLTDIKTKAEIVSNNSKDSKHLAAQSSKQLDEQKVLIETLATSMNEMSSTSSDVASSAQDAANAITSINNRTEESQALFVQTSSYVNELSGSIGCSQELSDQLAEYSSNIEQVLSVISGIAEQTNLLALNAAIEAARAGEQGRGFAVVADEVRTLASRTQESTTEIKSMIEQIQAASAKVQTSMQDSKNKAGICVDHAEIAKKALQDISNSVEDIMNLNIQIATAAEEQSMVSEEINKNTSHINDISLQVGKFSDSQYEANIKLAEEVSKQQALLNQFQV